jgi:hypothetical protein
MNYIGELGGSKKKFQLLSKSLIFPGKVAEKGIWLIIFIKIYSGGIRIDPYRTAVLFDNTFCLREPYSDM